MESPSNGKLKKPRKRYGEIDLPLFLIIMTLLVMGLVMMFSASYATAVDSGLPGSYYAAKQIKMAAIGLVVMFFLSYIDYHKYQKTWVAVGAYIASVTLLVMVLVKGAEENGAKRWLVIAGQNFQPSELVKFAIIITFSYFITKQYKRMEKFSVGIIPFMVMLGIIAMLMMMQPHLSGTILICIIGVTLMFVGGVKLSHLLGTGILGIVGMVALVFYKIENEGFTYFEKRIQSWRDPFADVSDATYQTCQSLIAIGSGGLFGLGLGESRQKYMYLPETKNDFVFAIICEELGFIGAVTVILLFVLFVFRGLYISSKAPDKFGMLIAVGLTVQIGIQAFLNMAVVSNLIPNTGISLPFFSYGGTALIMQLAQVGVLMNISRQSTIES
ncbi:MAG: putative lipid II flippase FtsW [Clostridiales bacterium]|nr:putative lipid II flippase FtsW [Clostridiales bacterium]